ncbi:DUF2145 domain-containing protein [Morganella morganii]|uniref:DUF2145 domain-containing protein n=1 Tax=Morganella morganii TaxID=582 RepID=UPI000F4923BB|nr:DUF2145 domain-containing protein [Morganella morganii]ROJ32620.1 hypothetical protein BFD15_10965 [Morganella morganii]
MRLLKSVFAAALLTASGLAYSGSQNCADKSPPTPQEAAQRTAQAKVLNDWLEKQGDRVVLLVRQGQALSDYGLSFSHAGYAVRERNGTWRVYHNLNTCGTAQSELWIQGLYQFIDDDLAGNTIATLHFPPALQSQLLKVLRDPELRKALHNPAYNMVAHPFATDSQNSNGWVLMVFAAARSPGVNSVSAGVNWLKSEFYIGSSAEAGLVKRALADSLMPHMSTDEQPVTGIVTFNSGDSLLGFLSRYGKFRVECSHGSFGSAVCMVPLPE